MFIVSYLPVGAADVEKFILRNQHQISFGLGRGAASTFFIITTHIPQKTSFFSVICTAGCWQSTILWTQKSLYTLQSVLRELSLSQVWLCSPTGKDKQVSGLHNRKQGCWQQQQCDIQLTVTKSLGRNIKVSSNLSSKSKAKKLLKITS